MRVCHIWHAFPPLTVGGVEQYILTLSNHLAQAHPEMTFLLITDNTMHPLLQTRKIPQTEKYGNLTVHRFGPNFLSASRGLYYKALHRSSGYIERHLTRKLYTQMANNQEVAKSDVFHIHGLWDLQYPTVGLRLSQHFGKPLIVSLHGEHVGSEFYYSMPLQKTEFTSILQHATFITTYSQSVHNTLEAMGFRGKTGLIPNFVSTQNFKRPPVTLESKPGNRVTMVCRLDPFKDPITAVQAFALVVDKDPTAKLQIIGDGPLYSTIKKLIDELNLEASVYLAGQHTDVRPFLWNNDIFLTGNAFVSILEAWSAGLAVVATNGETSGKLISNGKNGVVVQPQNPQKLAAALLQVMQNPTYRESIVKNGLETVGIYDITSVGKQFLDIYRSVTP